MRAVSTFLTIAGSVAIAVSAVASTTTNPSGQLNVRGAKMPVEWQSTKKVMANNQSQAKKLAAEVATEEPSMVWGWCDEPASAGGFPSEMYCISAIGITENITKNFAGCTVKSILINKGVYLEANPVIDIMLFKGKSEYNPEWDTYCLYAEEPFYQKTDVPFTGEEGEWVEFELDQPYTIQEGETFYAGWGYYNTNDNNMPLVGDDVYNDNPDTSWMVGYDLNYPDNQFWSNCWTAGANCIRLRLTGDNLPSDNVALKGANAPRLIELGTSAEVTLTVANKASSTIEELELSYATPGAEAKTVTVKDLSIAPGKKDKVKISGIEPQSAGNVLLEFKALTVNGNVDYDESDNIIATSLLCLPKGVGYDRNVLVEEGTGTWCGNCPRGIVAMREMTEKYPERFIGIAAHSGDEMEIEGYWSFLERYIDIVGYPYCTVDRVEGVNPYYPLLEASYLKELEIPAIAKVSVDDITLDGTTVNFNHSVEFAVPEEDTEYGWAFVITENNVGPYEQANYYNKPGALDGWDYTDPYVEMIYDEVACEALTIMGNNTIPANTEEGKEYSESMVIEATNVKDFDNAYLIVMVINKKTGYVENAVKKSITGKNGVEGVESDSADMMLLVENGQISLVSGNDVEVYSLAGVKVGTLKAGASIKVEKGIYVAKSNGAARKLLVK